MAGSPQQEAISKSEQMTQEQTQLAIKKAALEWRGAFDAIESPIVITDLSARVVRLNRAARELLERDYKDILGRNLADISEREPWLEASRLIAQVRETGLRGSGQTKCESNGRCWVVTASSFSGPEFEEDRVVVETRDITGMINLQEKLRHSELMSAMGQLVAGVAHEVRNPLFGITATVDAFETTVTMAEDFLTSSPEATAFQSECIECVDALRQGLGRWNYLMQELLDYGRPSALDPSWCLVADLIAEARSMCEPLATKYNVSVSENFSSTLSPIWVDRKRIVQVFSNLIENAIQHSPGSSRVVIDAEEIDKDGLWMRCSFKDRGAGFKADDLPKIFKPFFTRRRGGTGLGLSIVERIVAKHEGIVSARNLPEGGGEMIVELPIPQVENQSPGNNFERKKNSLIGSNQS